MKKRHIALALALATAIQTYAQRTTIMEAEHAEFAEAKLLYDASMYGAARTSFAEFRQKWGNGRYGDELSEDAAYFEAVSAKMLRNPDAPRLLEDFQHYASENKHRADAQYHLGDYYLIGGNSKKALKWFEKVNENRVSAENRVHLLYKKGYCLFMRGDHNLALAQFDKIRGQEGEYASAVKYYRAHVDYENGNHDVALKSFLELEKDDGFSTAASYYIAHIFYLQGHYTEAIRYARPLAESGSGKAAEMTRILGDSHFMLNEYRQAAETYDRLFRMSGVKPLRADYYHLGMAHYNLGDYESAAKSLSKVTSEADVLAQNAYYHLGACYIKNKDKKRARTAFEAASRYGFDAAISEDAHFNKLKLEYEMGFSPFNEIITSFVDFLNLYPASPHRDEVYDYMSKALVSTKNYKKALETMERIKNKDLKLYKAMQRIAFYRGLELYTDQNLEGAQEYLAYSLKYGDYDAKLKARAYYWQGECEYSSKNISAARDKYVTFINAYQASELSEFTTAHYNVAYTYFNTKDYTNARRWFVKYVSLASKKNDNLLADAYNRLGDCLYVERDFGGAVGYYDKALKASPSMGDYSMLQKGICLGLQQNDKAKIAQLDSLIANYPKSTYADNAYYEKARAYVSLGDIKSAIYNYKVVKERYPKGSLASRAMLQLGLLYYNNSEYDNSMAFYKRVINEYPSTPEATSALAGLRNVYMEQGDFDGYIAYTATLGSFAHVDLQERDSLLFVSASNIYMKGQSAEAKAGFRRYLDTFQDGRYVTPANYYLADCCYKDGEFDQALLLYKAVAEQPRSIFTEEALLRGGELMYKDNKFADALVLFERLETEAEVETNKIEAIIGQMRCLRKMGDAEKCIAGANKVIEMPQVSPEILREANYLKANSLIELKREKEALPVLQELAQNTKSAEGAEAKFLIADIYYRNADLDNAEKEVFDYAEKGTPHQYWLARSFILLADVYHAKGDDFQASQYLQSLKESYSANDDIADRIADRLSQWEANANTSSLPQ